MDGSSLFRPAPTPENEFTYVCDCMYALNASVDASPVVSVAPTCPKPASVVLLRRGVALSLSWSK